MRFDKPFTQQEPIGEETIARVADVLRTGRLHRYNTVPGETAPASALEAAFAAAQGARYCLATTSGGTALAIALRAVGVRPGDTVLANAFTLAPVPGAMHSVGARVALVEIDAGWHIDMDHLAARQAETGARVLMLSHMRGHIADMDAVTAFCEARGVTLIEDCAHTMGATWDGRPSGSFGRVACFSTQTYKHVNSGEGGLLTTDDEEVAARAIVMSGSYMLYASHGAAPDEAVFRRLRLDQPNLSSRIDNVRALIALDQLASLPDRVKRWNALWSVLAAGLRESAAIHLPSRDLREGFVGSSIQFRPQLAPSALPDLVAACAARGVDVKWFGAHEPVAFTSRFDSWTYLGEAPDLPATRAVLSRTCDMRVPLTFDEIDCRTIATIVTEEVERLAARHGAPERAAA